MPKNKDLKRHVRARMSKTGESYAAARSQVVKKQENIDFAGIAGMSDDAVAAKTGKTWKEWVRTLDSAGATSKVHRDIARYLREEEGVAAWWAQTVTVGYERIRGLRAKGQQRGGGYEVNKSKTFPVPVSTLYASFGARVRKRWMGDVELQVKTSHKDKSMRLKWDDGTSVDAYFWEKGPEEKAKSSFKHRELAKKSDADRVRQQWTERLSALSQLLKA